MGKVVNNGRLCAIGFAFLVELCLIFRCVVTFFPHLHFLCNMNFHMRVVGYGSVVWLEYGSVLTCRSPWELPPTLANLDAYLGQTFSYWNKKYNSSA